MMSWLYYLLEANLYLSIFYCFYRLFLRKETFYSLNRYYLILSSFFAFIIPFFQLGFLKQTNSLVLSSPIQSIESVNLPINSTITTIHQSFFTLDNLILTIYAIVAVLCFCKLCIGLFSIFKLIKKPFTIIENDIRLINLKGSGLAFSFFNLLFLDSKLPKRSTIIRHELVHIRQKHSLDVLFFEIIQIINWFNPFCYLLKKDIKLIHEYIADEAIIHQEVEKYDYAIFLIQNSQRINIVNLTNQIFSSSILKQRINMLNQKKSPSWARLKLAFVLPVIIGMLFVSTFGISKEYNYINLYPIKQNVISDTSKIKFTGLDKLAKNSNLFATDVTYDFKTHTQLSHEKRLIVINGEKIKDNNSFFAAANYEKKIVLNANEATKKYGDEGKFGAVELVGPSTGVIQYQPPGTPMLESEAKKLPPIQRGKVFTIERAENSPLVIPDKGQKYFYVTNNRLEKIYENENYLDNWDGKKGNTNKFKSTMIEQGTYSYILVVTTAKEKKAYQGYLQLQ